jgi:hypothetical protein
MAWPFGPSALRSVGGQQIRPTNSVAHAAKAFININSSFGLRKGTFGVNYEKECQSLVQTIVPRHKRIKQMPEALGEFFE